MILIGNIFFYTAMCRMFSILDLVWLYTMQTWMMGLSQ